MSHIASQHPAPEHFILHVSDTHFVGDGDLLHWRRHRAVFRLIVVRRVVGSAGSGNGAGSGNANTRGSSAGRRADVGQLRA